MNYRSSVIATILAATPLFKMEAAVTYFRESSVFHPFNEVTLDLDRNGETDLLIRLGPTLMGLMDDSPYQVVPLEGSRIAVTGDLASSFQIGDSIVLEDLNFRSGPDYALAGGTVTDAFGNPVAEGWGVTFDGNGLPTGPPENFVNLFLVELAGGVAWVDLEPYTVFGELPVQWGYRDSDYSSFQISPITNPVPEPSVLGLITIGCSFAFRRHRDIS